MNKLIHRAAQFAWVAHEGQIRKFTGEPYWNHLQRVAITVANVGATDKAVAAAWLHDTIEDTDVTYGDLVTEFGTEVANLVVELTKVGLETGNRATRKVLDTARLAKATDTAQTIKLADLIDNIHGMVAGDPKFAPIFVAEVETLVPQLNRGQPELFKRATQALVKARAELDGAEAG